MATLLEPELYCTGAIRLRRGQRVVVCLAGVAAVAGAVDSAAAAGVVRFSLRLVQLLRRAPTHHERIDSCLETRRNAKRVRHGAATRANETETLGDGSLLDSH